jgi:hypothetical protein
VIEVAILREVLRGQISQLVAAIVMIERDGDNEVRIDGVREADVGT